MRKRGGQPGGGPPLDKVVALLKDRAASIPQLADEAMLFYAVEVNPGQPDWDPNVGKALRMLKAKLGSVAWARAAISDAIKDAVKSNGLKMPQLAMPLRMIVTGRQAPMTGQSAPDQISPDEYQQHRPHVAKADTDVDE